MKCSQLNKLELSTSKWNNTVTKLEKEIVELKSKYRNTEMAELKLRLAKQKVDAIRSEIDKLPKKVMSTK